MNFRTHARLQAEACEALGSPFTARLLRLVADSLRPGTVVADRLLGWENERLAPDAVALRLTGALHYLVLSGQSPVLARLYHAPEQADDAALWRILEAAMRLKSDVILATLEQAPQTNEVQRAAIYIAAANWLNAALDVPFVLSELGSSAGLNLLWDHYALKIGNQTYGPADAEIMLTPQWRGPLPPQAPPVIRGRSGVDLNPLDPETDRMRLLSYIWPDQKERLARTGRALDLAAEHRPAVAQGHAIDWLEAQLSRPVPQALHLICHTVTWQYLSEQEQARGATLLARAGKRAREDEPIAHLSMEQDGEGPGAAITLTLWPGDVKIELGRADFHGAWIDWRAPTL